tara:strand:- start:10959 stop:11630 length:672 start_codon:yes stop_codon:yes gene_type:complete
MLYPTEDVLVDDTTVLHPPTLKRVKHFQSIDRYTTHDHDEGRNYGKFCVDTMKSGHKDSKNTALTVALKEVHTLRHSTHNNRNVGDATRHMGLSQYEERRVDRVFGDNYFGHAGVASDPDDTVMRLDPSAHLNAVEIADFQHGGTRPDAVRGTMMGAGHSVPVDNLDGSNLNNSYGLHYSIDIGPGSKIGKSQQQENMQRVSQQQLPTTNGGNSRGTQANSAR